MASKAKIVKDDGKVYYYYYKKKRGRHKKPGPKKKPKRRERSVVKEVKEKHYDVFTDNVDSVYEYKFEEERAVYIGRTIDAKKRDKAHRTSEKSSVYKFAHDNGIGIPEMTILEKDLTLKEGLEKEDFYVNKYRNMSYNVLNKAKTGVGHGSIGGLARKQRREWTYEVCRDIAARYKNRNEFHDKRKVPYKVSRQNGWLDDFFPPQKRSEKYAFVIDLLKNTNLSCRKICEVSRENGIQISEATCYVLKKEFCNP